MRPQRIDRLEQELLLAAVYAAATRQAAADGVDLAGVLAHLRGLGEEVLEDRSSESAAEYCRIGDLTPGDFVAELPVFRAMAALDPQVGSRGTQSPDRDGCTGTTERQDGTSMAIVPDADGPRPAIS